MLRQIAEKYEEYGKELCMCHIGFRKAFDSVLRTGLWRVMRHYEYPEKIVRILENAYKVGVYRERVGDEGKESEGMRRGIYPARGIYRQCRYIGCLICSRYFPCRYL